MKPFYLKIGGCVVLVLLVAVGIVVFWPGRGSQPAEVVAAKPDTQPKRAATARPSIRDIERLRARQTGIDVAARANPEAEKLYITALTHSKQTDPDSYKIVTSCCQQILRRYPSTPQA